MSIRSWNMTAFSQAYLKMWHCSDLGTWGLVYYEGCSGLGRLQLCLYCLELSALYLGSLMVCASSYLYCRRLSWSVHVHVCTACASHVLCASSYHAWHARYFTSVRFLRFTFSLPAGDLMWWDQVPLDNLPVWRSPAIWLNICMSGI